MARHEDVLTEISDDAIIALAINSVLMSSKAVRKLTRKIAKQQRRLRSMLTSKEWAAFLALEELLNHRAAVEDEVLVRWALSAGRRSAR